METRKFIKTNRIFLSALLLLLVILAVLLSLRNPAVSYKVAPDQVASLLRDSASQVSPVLLFNQISKGDKSMIIIDIRSSDEFAKGHIENSVNIPVRELLHKRSMALFKELKSGNTEAILYGEDQLQANGPWMLLKQLGFENLKILQGGYSFYKTLPLPDSLMKVRYGSWLVESPVKNTETLVVGLPSGPAAAAVADKKPEKIVQVKKTTTKGGGC